MSSVTETITEERRESLWERPLTSVVVLNWELVLYGLILVLAIATRFFDLGTRAVSHDESLHALRLAGDARQVYAASDSPRSPRHCGQARISVKPAGGSGFGASAT